MIAARFNITRGDFNLNVELNIPAHGITALFGASGCGKTTLLRAIAGLDKHRNGYCKLRDQLWQDEHYFLPPHQRAMGYVFQEASLFEHLDVRGNIEYGLKRIAPAARKISLQRAIELLGIGALLQRKPHTLSGGERQRVAIARALAVSPQLLLMDEPLSALDQSRKQEILPYIESLHRELDIPVLYVSHAVDEVARLADRIALMQTGRVVTLGDVHDVFTRLDLPLAHETDAAAIIETTVSAHDETFHLTRLEFVGGMISVSRQAMAVGERVRVKLSARDVSLTLQHQTGTSILNIFPARVDSITEESASHVTVRLLAGDVPVLARITRKSAKELALHPGKPVYAQVKSVALLG